MARAPKVCSYIGPANETCSNPQPCPDHQRKPWAESVRRTELPSDWERRRRSVLARDDVCVYCTAALATEVHHIHDKYDHSLSNLAGVCRPCHKALTASERWR